MKREPLSTDPKPCLRHGGVNLIYCLCRARPTFQRRFSDRFGDPSPASYSPLGRLCHVRRTCLTSTDDGEPIRLLLTVTKANVDVVGPESTMSADQWGELTRKIRSYAPALGIENMARGRASRAGRYLIDLRRHFGMRARSRRLCTAVDGVHGGPRGLPLRPGDMLCIYTTGLAESDPWHAEKSASKCDPEQLCCTGWKG